MPNYANNAVYITGTKAQLDTVEAMCPGGTLDFQQVCPIPAALFEEGTPGLLAAGCLSPFYQGTQPADACLREYAQLMKLETVPSLSELEARWPDLRALAEKQHALQQHQDPAKRQSPADRMTPVDRMTWICHEWGTKWNSLDGTVQRVSDTELRLWFTTAWCPPHGILVDLVMRWGVTLKLAYTIEMEHCGLREYTPEGPGNIWADLDILCLGENDPTADELFDMLNACPRQQEDPENRENSENREDPALSA